MGFLNNLARNLADKGQAIKLYAELPDFQAAINYVSAEKKMRLYESVMDFLSKAVVHINELTPDQKVVAGINMCQGQIMRLRNGDTDDAFARDRLRNPVQ